MLQKEWSQNRGGRIAGLLDIGTTHVACLIVALPKNVRASNVFETARVIGIGHNASGGVKAGVIVDLDDAEQAPTPLKLQYLQHYMMT